MDSFTNLFSLGRGGRANETAQAQGGRNDGNEQGGRVDGNMGTMGGQRRTSVGVADWDDTSVPLHGDDPSAPDVDARFGRGGEQTGTNNVFALGGGRRTSRGRQPSRHRDRRTPKGNYAAVAMDNGKRKKQ